METQRFWNQLNNDPSAIKIKDYRIIEINTLWTVFLSMGKYGEELSPLNVFYDDLQSAIDYTVNRAIEDEIQELERQAREQATA